MLLITLVCDVAPSKSPKGSDSEITQVRFWSILQTLSDPGRPYEAINTPVLRRIPDAATRVLDVGCGSGALGRQLKLARNCHVTGVTNSATEAERATDWLDQVLLLDLNQSQCD